MRKTNYEYRVASIADLNARWDINIANNPGDERWVKWKIEYIEDNISGKCKTFVIIDGDTPIGEATLLLSPECGAINGRNMIADGKDIVNINALRVDKPYRGRGLSSSLVRFIEQCAKNDGYTLVTIGVEANEANNLAIYLHWGYKTFVTSDFEDGELVLYYSKKV